MGRKERIHRYVANIKISNVPLGNAFNQVYHVLGKFEAYGTDLEIENCTSNTRGLLQVALDQVMYFVENFSLHGCQLMLDDLVSIIYGIYMKNNCYDLSNNIILDRDPVHLMELKESIRAIRNAEVQFKEFSLLGCSFSMLEKKDLMHEAGSLNLLM